MVFKITVTGPIKIIIIRYFMSIATTNLGPSDSVMMTKEMTGTTACGDASWGWGSSGGIDVDKGEGETSDDDDNEGFTDLDGSVGIEAKSSGAAAGDAIGEVGRTRYNLHQLILPDASILPAPRVGVRGELFNTGFEACLAEWKSRELNR